MRLIVDKTHRAICALGDAGVIGYGFIFGFIERFLISRIMSMDIADSLELAVFGVVG